MVVADEAPALGYEPWLSGLHGVADDYLAAFTDPGDDDFVLDLSGGPLFSVWIYLLGAIAAALVLLRRGMPAATQIAGALALSAVTLQIGLYVLAMAIAYRFELPVVVAALLTVPVAVAVVARGRREGRNSARVAWRSSGGCEAGEGLARAEDGVAPVDAKDGFAGGLERRLPCTVVGSRERVGVPGVAVDLDDEPERRASAGRGRRGGRRRSAAC